MIKESTINAGIISPKRFTYFSLSFYYCAFSHENILLLRLAIVTSFAGHFCSKLRIKHDSPSSSVDERKTIRISVENVEYH